MKLNDLRPSKWVKKVVYSLYKTEIEKRLEESKRFKSNYQSFDREKLSRLHRSFFLKKLPYTENFSLSAYRNNELGGDYYNFHRVKDKLIFYLVDVMGHGIDGAMLNIFIRENIRNFIIKFNREKNLSASDITKYIFQKYNKEEFPADYFLSVQVGVIDIINKRLSYSNAGSHVPAYIISSNGTVLTLSSKGFPISNVLDEDLIEFNEEIIKLGAGEKLFLTTDGLIEEENNGTIYGENRLKSILRKNHYLTADLIGQAVENDLREFSGKEEYHDDVTFLIIESEAIEEKIFQSVGI